MTLVNPFSLEDESSNFLAGVDAQAQQEIKPSVYELPKSDRVRADYYQSIQNINAANAMQAAEPVVSDKEQAKLVKQDSDVNAIIASMESFRNPYAIKDVLPVSVTPQISWKSLSSSEQFLQSTQEEQEKIRLNYANVELLKSIPANLSKEDIDLVKAKFLKETQPIGAAKSKAKLFGRELGLGVSSVVEGVLGIDRLLTDQKLKVASALLPDAASKKLQEAVDVIYENAQKPIAKTNEYLEGVRISASDQNSLNKKVFSGNPLLGEMPKINNDVSAADVGVNAIKAGARMIPVVVGGLLGGAPVAAVAGASQAFQEGSSEEGARIRALPEADLSKIPEYQLRLTEFLRLGSSLEAAKLLAKEATARTAANAAGAVQGTIGVADGLLFRGAAGAAARKAIAPTIAKGVATQAIQEPLESIGARTAASLSVGERVNLSRVGAGLYDDALYGGLIGAPVATAGAFAGQPSKIDTPAKLPDTATTLVEQDSALLPTPTNNATVVDEVLKWAIQNPTFENVAVAALEGDVSAIEQLGNAPNFPLFLRNQLAFGEENASAEQNDAVKQADSAVSAPSVASGSSAVQPNGNNPVAATGIADSEISSQLDAIKEISSAERQRPSIEVGTAGDVGAVANDGRQIQGADSLAFDPRETSQEASDRLALKAIALVSPTISEADAVGIVAKSHADSYKNYLSQQGVEVTNKIAAFEEGTKNSIAQLLFEKQTPLEDQNVNQTREELGARVDSNGVALPESSFIERKQARESAALEIDYLSKRLGSFVFDAEQKQSEEVFMSDPTRVKNAIARDFGFNPAPFLSQVKITESQSFGNSQAFFDPRSKKITLIANKIQVGDEVGVFLHETFHKKAGQKLSNSELAQLRRGVDAWQSAEIGTPERIVYDAAFERAAASENFDAEIVAYAIEEAERIGALPNASAPKGSLAKWLATVKALFDKVASSFFKGKTNLTVYDLRVISRAIAGLEFFGEKTVTPELNFDPVLNSIMRDASKQSKQGERLSNALSTNQNQVTVGVTELIDDAKFSDRLLRSAIDMQAPIGRALEQATGEPRELSGAWQAVKLFTTKRDARSLDIEKTFVDPIVNLGLSIAKKTGLKLDEAIDGILRYRQMLHVIDANKQLAVKTAQVAEEKWNDLLAQSLVTGVFQGVALAQPTGGRGGELASFDEALKTAKDTAIQSVALNSSARLAGKFTDAQAQKNIAQLESFFGKPVLLEANKVAQALSEKNIADTVDAGIISTKQAQEMRAMYPNYVPLTQDESLGDIDPYGELMRQQGFMGGVNNSIVEAMQGYGVDSQRAANSPYMALLINAQRVTNRTASQEMKYQFWLTYKKQAQQISDLQQKVASGALPATTAIPTPLFEVEKLSTKTKADPQTRGMTFRGPGGALFSIRFANATLTDALYAGSSDLAAGAIVKAILSITRLSSRLVTQMVASFAPINLIRDVGTKSANIFARNYAVTALKNKKVTGVEVAKQYAKALASLNIPVGAYEFSRYNLTGKEPTNPSQTFVDLKRLSKAGGLSTFGSQFATNNADVLKRLRSLEGVRKYPTKAVDAILKTVESYNLTFDVVSSLAAFKAFEAVGMDEKQAAFSTLDLMNFRNKGASSSVNFIRLFYMFANPTLQDAYQNLKSLNTPRGKKLVAGFYAAGMLLYAMLDLLNGDDDDLNRQRVLGTRTDQRSTFEIERNIPIHLGDDVWAKIPVPFGLIQLSWAAAVNTMRYSGGSYTAQQAAGEQAKSLIKSVSPVGYSEVPIVDNFSGFMVSTLSPQFAKPIVEVAANTSAFGIDIKKQRLDPSKPAFQQAKKETEEFWVDASQGLLDFAKIDIAPESLRHLFRGYLPGTPSNMLNAAINDKEERGIKTRLEDDPTFRSLNASIGLGRAVAGESRALENKYYTTIKQGESFLKQARADAGDAGDSEGKNSDAVLTSVKKKLAASSLSPEESRLALLVWEQKRKMLSINRKAEKKIKEISDKNAQGAQRLKDAENTSKEVLQFLLKAYP